MSISLEQVDACLPITGLKAVSLSRGASTNTGTGTSTSTSTKTCTDTSTDTDTDTDRKAKPKPTTGIHSSKLQFHDRRIVFQGQGPYTRLIDEKTGKKLAELRTFKRNNVHGFLPFRGCHVHNDDDDDDDGNGDGDGDSNGKEKREWECFRVICWGAQSLRIIELVLSYSRDGGEGGLHMEAHLSPASAEYLAPDWIMNGCAESDDDAALSSDKDEDVESRISEKKKKAYFVTAHNALLELRIADTQEEKETKKQPRYPRGLIRLRLRQVATGVKSILYSADTVSLSPSHILVAAGTVFGEIIVWSYYTTTTKDHTKNETSSSSIHHFFTGHEGSIFGVQISPPIPALHGPGPGPNGRLLASCSDDRTVRIWDISDCERRGSQDPAAYATDGFELRSTGFGFASGDDDDDYASSGGFESCLVSAFGHGARIWGVYFLPVPVSGSAGSAGLEEVDGGGCGLRLVSRGEDATCIVWDLSWERGSLETTGSGGGGGDSLSQAGRFRLRQTASFHHHSGKHIWSLDVCGVDGGTAAMVYTGGADGALKTLRISASLAPEEGSLAARTSTQIETNGQLRSFDFVAHDCLIAVSPRGDVRLGWFERDVTPTEYGMKPHVIWENLCVADDLASYSNVSGSPEKGLALLANSNGLIRLYNHTSKTLTAIVECGQRPLGLFMLHSESDTLPSNSPSTLHFVASFATGNKAYLFSVDMSETSEPRISQSTLMVPPKFHGNCASFICRDQYIAIGSTDGWLSIYPFPEPKQPLQEQQLEPLIFQRGVHGNAGVKMICSMNLLTGDREAPSEYFVTCGRDGDYCVHAVEHNSTTGTFSLVPIHRSSQAVIANMEGLYFDRATHDLILYGFRSRQFILWNETRQTEVFSAESGGARRNWAFYPNERVDGVDRSGLFVWDRNRDFNSICVNPELRRSVRAGGHGREIKSMAVCSATKGVITPLFATGAEDTTVRIFSPKNSNIEGPWGAFESLCVLNNHGSGMQQVSWSRDGEYLFSSSGNEEFFVWRVRQVPGFGVTAALMAANPKEDPQSDLRVTSFDMLEVGEPGYTRHGFLVCLTYSNSTIKIFHLSPSADRDHFTLLAKGTYTSNCLTQAQFVLKSSSSVNLVTAATDGYITLWDLTSVLERFYTINASTEPAALAAKLPFPFQDRSITPATISCENRYQIHSSSVKTLELVAISDAVSLIVTGGDDNALAISILRDQRTSAGNSTRVTTVSIPDAHAAAVTATKLLGKRQLGDGTVCPRTEAVFASSGNDQRVKVWSIQVDGDGHGDDDDDSRIAIRMILDRYSAVADASSMDVIDGGAEGSKLVVCGVGMEMLGLQ